MRSLYWNELCTCTFPAVVQRVTTCALGVGTASTRGRTTGSASRGRASWVRPQVRLMWGWVPEAGPCYGLGGHCCAVGLCPGISLTCASVRACATPQKVRS